MYISASRPKFIEYSQMSKIVMHLRSEGVSDENMAKRITQIGAVDLDMLQVVLRIL